MSREVTRRTILDSVIPPFQLDAIQHHCSLVAKEIKYIYSDLMLCVICIGLIISEDMSTVLFHIVFFFKI